MWKLPWPNQASAIGKMFSFRAVITWSAVHACPGGAKTSGPTVPTEEIAPSTCSFFGNCSASKIGARLPATDAVWSQCKAGLVEDQRLFPAVFRVQERPHNAILLVQLCQLKLSPQFAELEVQVPVKNSAHGTIGHCLVESHFRLQPTVAHVATYRRSGQAPTRLNKERAVSARCATLRDIACARIKPDHAIYQWSEQCFGLINFPDGSFFGQGST